MYCVGLTGSIASGKSTAIRFFQSMGVATLSADEVARNLTQPGEIAYHLIHAHFGHDILTSTGELNRKALRTRIIADKNARLWLENLMHPLIEKNIQDQIKTCNGPYTVIEIPLLTSNSGYPFLNRVLTILSQPALQIARVASRDNCTLEEAAAFLNMQPTDTDRAAIADDIIINNNSEIEFNAALKKLHDKYLLLATNKRL